MVNIFQVAVERLVEIGFYNFLLPFILFTTVLYAVLRKTKVLGESVVIHGIISVVAGMFVFGVPVILGTSIVPALTAFLTQGAIVLVVVLVAFLIASFFYPNIIEKLPDVFKGGGPAAWIVWATIAFAVSAGLFSIIGNPFKSLLKAIKVPAELMTVTVAIFVILIILLIVSMSMGKEVK